MSLVPPQNHGNVPVPSPPQAIPTIDDITTARRYIINLTECRNLSTRPEIATAEDISRAEIYKQTLINQHCRAEQGNLNQNLITEAVKDEIRRAMEDHRGEMRQSLEDLREEMRQSMEDLREEMRQSMEELRREVRQSVVTATNPALIISAREYNAGCGTGAHREYTILPFMIGGELVNPDAIESPLPLLTRLDVIDGLDDNQLERYLLQYHIRFHQNHMRTIKLQRLKEHLGVMVDSTR